MGKLTVEKCDIEGVLIITPEVREDARDISWRPIRRRISRLWASMWNSFRTISRHREKAF